MSSMKFMWQGDASILRVTRYKAPDLGIVISWVGLTLTGQLKCETQIRFYNFRSVVNDSD